MQGGRPGNFLIIRAVQQQNGQLEEVVSSLSLGGSQQKWGIMSKDSCTVQRLNGN